VPDGGAGLVSAFGNVLSPRDSELLQEPRYASLFAQTMREALQQGTSGGGWDNVAWTGE
jgi:hypothetical protein